MKGRVSCRFVGGPQDGETLDLAAMACQDTLAVESDSWFRENANGSVAVVTGTERRRDPKWVSYSTAIYEKEKPSIPGGVTYQFVREKMVDRCEKVLPDKGRRCKNDALEGERYCRAHINELVGSDRRMYLYSRDFAF